MRVADYIANFLVSKDVKDIFMLTGYGAMYINDAIEISGINYYATRNEATAPIMAVDTNIKMKLIIPTRSSICFPKANRIATFIII